MKLALLGLVAVSAYNNPMSCFPPSCRLDANCVDSIHGTTAKCCGGVCSTSTPSGRLIGESCTPAGVNGYESCAGFCHPALYCSEDDSKCHARRGPGCACIEGLECASGNCRAVSPGGPLTCAAATNGALDGEECAVRSECKSNLCTNSKCASLALGDSCSETFSSDPKCVSTAVCRPPLGAFSPLSCQAPCAVGEAACCRATNDCVQSPAGVVCDTSNNNTCTAPPGLGEQCPFGVCSDNTLICSRDCSSGTCVSPSICQKRNQLAIGAACFTNTQCVVGATCPGGVCTAPIPPLSIPLGESCGTSSNNRGLCMPPGDMCELNGTANARVCKRSRTLPVGSTCFGSNNPDECVLNSTCTFGGLGYSCVADPVPIVLAVGSNCTLFSGTTCDGGDNNCVWPDPGQGGSCFSCSPNQQCCSCIAPNSVQDGGRCASTRQCGPNSRCLTNGTCASIIGMDCETRSECLSATYDQFDCNCGRKCYLLNAPTPRPASQAPTPAPPPTPGICDAQRDAWNLVVPIGFQWSNTAGYVTYTNFDSPTGGFTPQFVPQALALSPADQATLVDFVCCISCRYYGTSRFNSRIFQAYQVDCAKKTITRLEDTCNDQRNNLAFLGCWAPVMSPASATSVGLGALFVAALFY